MSNKTNIMKNTFLILRQGTASEWLTSFAAVQNEMNKLEKQGIVSRVVVQKFSNMLMIKEITYDYNGVNWEKR